MFSESDCYMYDVRQEHRVYTILDGQSTEYSISQSYQCCCCGRPSISFSCNFTEGSSQFGSLDIDHGQWN
jgi:hypothetical protein